MKRLVFLTVGVTHSGKSSTARALADAFQHSVVLDQDWQAEFLNTHYKRLLPETGSNILKMKVSETLLQYAIEHTTHHIILCNANLDQKGRQQLLSRFPQSQFVRVCLYFQLQPDTLQQRIEHTTRSTTIFRDQSVTYEALLQKQLSTIDIPTIEEFDYLLTISEYQTIHYIIEEIQQILEKERLQ